MDAFFYVSALGNVHLVRLAVPALSVDELKHITDSFGIDASIDKWSCGKVYNGILSNGQAVVLKKLDASKQSEQELLAQVSIVSNLKNEHVLELVGYCIDDNLRILAYEYAPNGSLHDVLHGPKGVEGAEPGSVLSWSQRVKIAVGVAKGLEYLHKAEPSIVHRDVTSSNVLLFDNHVAKIADFDLSNQSPDKAVRLRSTRFLLASGYHGPEYATAEEITEKGDVYSFGVILLELLTGRVPVDYTRRRSQQTLVAWAVPKLSEDKLKECVDARLEVPSQSRRSQDSCSSCPVRARRG
ncbi:unnamed protein product [Rhodiola kirilowii]